jgi:hypothetical protein
MGMNFAGSIGAFRDIWCVGIRLPPISIVPFDFVAPFTIPPHNGTTML